MLATILLQRCPEKRGRARSHSTRASPTRRPGLRLDGNGRARHQHPVSARDAVVTADSRALVITSRAASEVLGRLAEAALRPVHRTRTANAVPELLAALRVTGPSTEANHIHELQLQLARPDLEDRARMFLGYAVAKELDDLQRFDEAFHWFAGAATARRSRLASPWTSKNYDASQKHFREACSERRNTGRTRQSTSSSSACRAPEPRCWSASCGPDFPGGSVNGETEISPPLHDDCGRRTRGRCVHARQAVRTRSRRTMRGSRIQAARTIRSSRNCR